MCGLKKLTKTEASISVINVNARSVVNVNALILLEAPDTFCITETWLHPDIFSHEIFPPGYQVFWND